MLNACLVSSSNWHYHQLRSWMLLAKVRERVTEKRSGRGHEPPKEQITVSHFSDQTLSLYTMYRSLDDCFFPGKPARLYCERAFEMPPIFRKQVMIVHLQSFPWCLQKFISRDTVRFGLADYQLTPRPVLSSQVPALVVKYSTFSSIAELKKKSRTTRVCPQPSRAPSSWK